MPSNILYLRAASSLLLAKLLRGMFFEWLRFNLPSEQFRRLGLQLQRRHSLVMAPSGYLRNASSVDRKSFPHGSFFVIRCCTIECRLLCADRKGPLPGNFVERQVKECCERSLSLLMVRSRLHDNDRLHKLSLLTST